MADRDDILARVAETLKEPVQLSRDLDARIMAEIRTGAAPARRAPRTPRTILQWLRRPAIHLSPLGGLAAAAIIAAAAVGVGRFFPAPEQNGVTPTAAAPSALPTSIEFVLVAPTAQSVSVVGDFNDWDLSATPLQPEAGHGVWSVTVPLAPGRYRYSFLVDGNVWRQDPNRAPALEDEFGRPNSVVTIGGAL